ncbi:MAG: hypothetical protein HC923_12835 [Myxococcales bacterium]|nr:hypothetical protein [Myxococcales bacterium]
MVDEGTFREDLFYRLNVVSIHVPPLRERAEDVAVLAKHFVKVTGERLALTDADISQEALALLEAYPWPGNVRELENAIERALVLSESNGRITALDLDGRFDRRPSSQDAEDEDLDLKSAIVALERRLIRKALDVCGGNRTRAAQALGISHRTLLYKLKEFGVG